VACDVLKGDQRIRAPICTEEKTHAHHATRHRTGFPVSPPVQWNGKLDVPAGLRIGHDQIRAGLVRATTDPGRVGKDALLVARLCLPHFEQEEKAVFPVLSLLRELAYGEVRPEMATILPLVIAFSEWQESLDKQHEVIAAAVESLLQTAHREGNREAAEVAYGLKVHERVEADAIYPAAALVGKYVREGLKLPPISRSEA
jgi:hypothetical protein